MRTLLRFLSASGVGGTTLNQTLVLLAGALSGITLARALGPQGRGELAVVLLWPGILVLFSDLGFGFALSYHAGKGKERIDDLWTIALLSGIGIGGTVAFLGWLAIPHLVRGLESAAARSDFGLALVSIPLILTNGAQSYLLLGRGLVRDYNAIRIATALAYLGAVALAAVFDRTVAGFAAAYVLGQACGLAVATALTVRRFRPGLAFSPGLARKVFSYGIRTQMASLAAQTNLRADQAVMSVMLAPRALGFYVIAVGASGILSPLMNALTIVILPRTTHAESDAHGVALAVRHIQLACVVSLPVIAISIVLMPWMLPLFFGRAYAPAVVAAQILLIASLFQGMNALIGNSLRGLGRPGMPAIAEGAGMVITIVLLVLLLRPLGIAGAAIASLSAYLLVTTGEILLLARIAGVGVGRLLFSLPGGPLLSRQMVRGLLRRSPLSV